MESKKCIWKTNNVDITTLYSLHFRYSDCCHNIKMAIGCCGNICIAIYSLYSDFKLASSLSKYYDYNKKMLRQFNV